MEEQWITFIGLFAAACTTVAFFPQFWKAWKTRSTKDLALPTFLLFSLGIFCWLVYGLLISNLPIIAANLVSVVLAVGILLMKLKYG